MGDRFECKKFKFERFQTVQGFIAFDHSGKSVGFDEVCSHIDELEAKLAKAVGLIKDLDLRLCVTRQVGLPCKMCNFLKTLEEIGE